MANLHRFPPATRFIETGLGSGATLRCAANEADPPYAELYSIEIDAELISRQSHMQEDPRVHLLQGSSPALLPSLCDPHVSTVFWLDAHYSAGMYTSDSARDQRQLDPAYGQCPLLAELAVIRAVPWRIWPWILIDDAVCMDADWYAGLHAAYDRAQYPRREQIIEALPFGYTLQREVDPNISRYPEPAGGLYFRCYPPGIVPGPEWVR